MCIEPTNKGKNKKKNVWRKENFVLRRRQQWKWIISHGNLKHLNSGCFVRIRRQLCHTCFSALWHMGDRISLARRHVGTHLHGTGITCDAPIYLFGYEAGGSSACIIARGLEDICLCLYIVCVWTATCENIKLSKLLGSWKFVQEKNEEKRMDRERERARDLEWTKERSKTGSTLAAIN